MSFRNSKGVGTGGTSVLMILVTLCLVIFSTLSIISATADYKQSSNNRRAVEGYYSADYEAQRKIARLDAVLLQAGKEAGQDENRFMKRLKDLLAEEDGVTLVSNGDTVTAISFTETVDEARDLQVTLTPLPPGGTRRYAVAKYQVVASGDWSIPQGGLATP